MTLAGGMIFSVSGSIWGGHRFLVSGGGDAVVQRRDLGLDPGYAISLTIGSACAPFSLVHRQQLGHHRGSPVFPSVKQKPSTSSGMSASTFSCRSILSVCPFSRALSISASTLCPSTSSSSSKAVLYPINGTAVLPCSSTHPRKTARTDGAVSKRRRDFRSDQVPTGYRDCHLCIEQGEIEQNVAGNTRIARGNVHETIGNGGPMLLNEPPFRGDAGHGFEMVRGVKTPNHGP